MKTVEIKIKITIFRLTEDGFWGHDEIVFEKTINIQPGDMSKARSICTRQFNKHLKAHADTNMVIIGGEYRGQLKESPYSTFSGSLTGQRGKIVRRDGTYDV